jgi:dipeptidyl aminopeptidase/acylaminoacyl peptidase
MHRSSASRRRRPSRRRIGIVVLIVLVVIAITGYVGFSTYVYNQLGPVTAGCPATEGFADIQDPTAFSATTTVGGVKHDVDTTPYLMPVPQTVVFPARSDPKVAIVAWWEPAATPDAPAVVIVHGRNGCRRNSGNLLVAGMLHRHDMGVLLIDMRNHGDSTVTDGLYAAGADEYLDVLGAFDWLRSQGVPAPRIGLFGFSGGAIATMIAMGEEPAVAAIWTDTSWPDVREVFDDGLRDGGLPTFFGAGAVAVGSVLNGVDIAGRSPVAALARLDGRPIFLLQGANDPTLKPRYLDELAAAIRAAGGTVDPWLVPGAGHTQAHFLYPDEYERRLVGFFGPALGGTAGQ